MLAGKPSPSLPQGHQWLPPPSLPPEWAVLHPASSRAFPTHLSVFPPQGVQEDQPQWQGESMHTEMGPCVPSLGAGQLKGQAVLGLLWGGSAHGTGCRLNFPSLIDSC